MRDAPHVVVCGAGLTGLTTAWQLQQRGIGVTVLEAGDAVGGVMQSTARDGFLVEHGPNSCLLTQDIATLVDALELTPMLRLAAPAAQRRYIVRDGTPLCVPMSPLAMIRSPLFSLSAKLRVLREPFIAPRRVGDDESVAAFVRRRLGDEPMTWAVDPFVSGVYAGDPERLSVRHAFPRLAALEREHGSIVRGAIAGGRANRTARGSAPRRAAMVSFRDGMGMLPAALASRIGSANILLGSRITGIDSSTSGCSVTFDRDGVSHRIDAACVVSTLPAHALAHLALPASARTALAELTALRYPAVSSLALGFRRADVAHPLDGFGMLVPQAEQRATLGVLFSSTLFDGRAPSSDVLLTCFLGGSRHPDLGTASTDALLARVLPELSALLGVRGAPTFVQHTVWPRAIPQYELGHDAVVRAAESIERSMPGVLIDGQFRRGVSVGDCVTAGTSIADRVTATLDVHRAMPLEPALAALGAH